MANTTTTAPTTRAAKAKTAQPQRLRWHPVRLLYVFVATLVVGILYSEAQAILTDPSSALDPTQLLDELREPSKTSTPEPAKVSPEVSAEHIRYVRQVLACVHGEGA